MDLKQRILGVLSEDTPRHLKEIVRRLGLADGKYCRQTEYTEPRAALLDLVAEGRAHVAGKKGPLYLRGPAKAQVSEDTWYLLAKARAAEARAKTKAKARAGVQRERAKARAKEAAKALRAKEKATAKACKAKEFGREKARRRCERNKETEIRKKQREKAKREQRWLRQHAQQGEKGRQMRELLQAKKRERERKEYESRRVLTAPRRECLVDTCADVARECGVDVCDIWECLREAPPIARDPRPRTWFAKMITGREFRDAAHRRALQTRIPAYSGYVHPHGDGRE